MNISFPFLWLFRIFFLLDKTSSCLFLLSVNWNVLFGHRYLWTLFCFHFCCWVNSFYTWSVKVKGIYSYLSRSQLLSWQSIEKKFIYIFMLKLYFFPTKKKRKKKKNRKKNPLERRLQIQGNISFFFKSSYRQGLVEICLDTHGSSMSR